MQGREWSAVDRGRTCVGAIRCGMVDDRQSFVDVADGYVRCIDRIVGLVREHGAAVALPMCPGWTLRELLGHLNGLAEDWELGHLDRYASASWTAAQVERHRATPLADLCEELPQRARLLVTLPPNSLMGPPPRWAYGDALVHEADVCEALGIAPTVPADDVVRHLGAGLSRWELAGAGVRLTVETPERTVTVGADEVDAAHAVSVAGSAYELWRFVYGRRNRDAILRMAWTGDAGVVLACGLPYPFRIPD